MMGRVWLFLLLELACVAACVCLFGIVPQNDNFFLTYAVCGVKAISLLAWDVLSDGLDTKPVYWILSTALLLAANVGISVLVIL